MYKSLKRIAQVILPKSLLQKNESFFRKLISLKYKGDNFQCNICDFKLKQFIELDDRDLLCPNCGSRCRTRRLYKTLHETNALNGTALHFSPPRALSEKFKKLDNLNYYSSDFENEFIADYNYDITAIASESDFYDLIICYHVLEHIEDDIKAMSELYRVLKPNGICFIQTPFKVGDIYEDRKKAFGQEDHVRVFSIKGLQNRLESVGFKVKIKTFDKDTDNTFGLKPETVFIVKK